MSTLQKISGKVFVLGDDIDTDQIIPAQYLVYSLDKPGEREKYGQYALSGVPADRSGLPKGHIPLTPEGAHRSPFTIIVAGKNFGCGSSREHAPAALQISGIQAVVAPSYARIFYRNSVDGGFLLPAESEASLVAHFHTGDQAVLDLKGGILENLSRQHTFALRPLGGVTDIVAAGGIFEYARQTGKLRKHDHAR